MNPISKSRLLLSPRAFVLVVLVLIEVGCTQMTIPNTDVEDTDFNRGVVDFCEDYRHAVERRNVPLLLKLADQKYYEDGGLKVLAIKGLEVAKPVDQVKLPDYASYRVARELFLQHRDVDSVLIQGRWRSVAYVQELEDETGKLVVSSTAASLWWVMKTLGMRTPIAGFGKLLQG